MENNQFWVFFVIAIIAGVAIAFAASNASTTGYFSIRDLFTSQPSLGSVACNDPDGNNNFVKGTCTDSKGTHADFCNGSNINEYICNNNQCVPSMLDCTYGCSNGACLTEAGVATNGEYTGEWEECLDCECSCNGTKATNSTRCQNCDCICATKTSTGKLEKCGGKCMCDSGGNYSCMVQVDGGWVKEGQTTTGQTTWPTGSKCTCMCARPVFREAECAPKSGISIDWLPCT
jgi:hypothetical protein